MVRFLNPQESSAVLGQDTECVCYRNIVWLIRLEKHCINKYIGENERLKRQGEEGG